MHQKVQKPLCDVIENFDKKGITLKEKNRNELFKHFRFGRSKSSEILFQTLERKSSTIQRQCCFRHWDQKLTCVANTNIYQNGES
jgi:hypothetical protein